MKILATLAALMLCQGAMAQPFKCTDAAGKTTYSSMSCSDLGLKDAGEVKDRIQVTPALKVPPSRPSSASQNEPPARPAGAETPAAPPDRRCFTTTVKGKSVTRCNDKPGEE